MKQLSAVLILSSLLLAACGSTSTPTPDLEATVQAALAATQTAQPTNTPTPTLPPPTDTPTPTSTPQLPTPTPTLGPGEPKARPADDMVMVYVPAGTFQMGSDETDPSAKESEKPPHQVTLDAFWIDRYEVSNAQYARCVEADVCQESGHADDATYTGADLPVVGVPWQDAVDYCRWAGGRLPTEAEWEYAARGTDGPIYPWGDTFDSSKANVQGNDDGYLRTAPVDSFPTGASWVGVLHMAGNVWEWVDDWYDGYPGTTHQNDYFGTTYKVLRGGSWDIDEEHVRAANRLPVPPSIYPYYVGFRCVVEPDN